MKNFILTILVLQHFIYSFSQSLNSLNEVLKIEKCELHKINRELKTKKTNDETVKIEVDRFGRILLIESEQPHIVKVLVGKYVFPAIEKGELVPTKYHIEIRNKKLKSCKTVTYKDTIKSQILTIIKLSECMKSKKYSEARKLFSRKQRKAIKKLEKNTELFAYWCNSWTLDEDKLSLYLVNTINANKSSDFKLENGIWKIDEK